MYFIKILNLKSLATQGGFRIFRGPCTGSLLQLVIRRNGKFSTADCSWPVWFRRWSSLCRGLGCVCFLLSAASELVQVFGEGRRLHVNTFFMEFFGKLLNVKAALFHPFQGRGQSADGLFHGQITVPFQSNLGWFGNPPRKSSV